MLSRLFLVALLVLGTASQLPNRLDQKLAEVAKAHPETTLGFYAVDLSNGQVLASHRAETNMAPASILKTLTTAAALEILGASYRFETTFACSGNLVNGSLKGNLHVLPSGDPSLGSRYFNDGTRPNEVYQKLIAFLKEKGVTAIDGKLILELHQFDSERVPPSWSFDDLGNYYGASVGPMNCFDNTIYLDFASGRAGTTTQLKGMNPDVAGLTFENEVLAARIGYDNAYVYGAPRQYNRSLRGQIPENRSSFKVKASMPEPELFAMLQLVKELRAAGIEVPQGAVSFRNEVATEKHIFHYSHFSPSLTQLVKTTNMESNNQFAEALLKAIALQKTGEWSRKKGIGAVEKFFADKISIGNANLYDGSGLSRFNGVSPKMMAELMAYMWTSPNKKAFYESLPIAGVSGSIKGMFKGSKAQNNLRAKSGYVDKVRSYSGYTKTATGTVAAFTIIANNYACSSSAMRNDLESVLRTLAD